MAEQRERIEINGRAYVEIGANGSLARDLFVMYHARHAGLTNIAPRDGETTEALGERILGSLISSGHTLPLLGGFLIPEGKAPEDWTEAMAHETAAALGRVTDGADKEKVTAQLLSIMVGFFASGLGSWIASGRASAADGSGSSPKKTTPGGGDSGTPSSADSEDTTPTVASPSPAGA